MRFLGFLLLAFASGVMVYEKISLMRQRAAEYTATHSLLVYVKGALASERRTPAEALLGFGRGELGEAARGKPMRLSRSAEAEYR